MTNPETRFVAEPGSHEATVTAVLDAPPSKVFRAYVEPDLHTQWWGPAELTSRIEKFDVRTNGSWRIVHTDADGTEYAFRGVYHVVIPDELIIDTFEWEGMPNHVCLQTTRLEPVDDGKRTRLIQHAVFQSVEDRDGMRDSGMEAQAPIGMAQLAAVLEKL